MIDFLGHIFYSCVLIGTVLIGWKNKWGWLVRGAGEAGWIGIGFALDLSSIWLWGFAFLAMELWNFGVWHYEDKFMQSQGAELAEVDSGDNCICVRGTPTGRCSESPDGEQRSGFDVEPACPESLSGISRE